MFRWCSLPRVEFFFFKQDLNVLLSHYPSSSFALPLMTMVKNSHVTVLPRGRCKWSWLRQSIHYFVFIRHMYLVLLVDNFYWIFVVKMLKHLRSYGAMSRMEFGETFIKSCFESCKSIEKSCEKIDIVHHAISWCK